MRSTSDWAALLDGTTPAPWETETHPRLRYANGDTWEEVGNILICSDAELGPLFGLPEQTVEEEEQGPSNMANALLAAAAPEAVAEVVRLRRELEALRGYNRSEANDPRRLRWAEFDQEADVVIELHQDQADRITRILEGDTNA